MASLLAPGIVGSGAAVKVTGISKVLASKGTHWIAVTSAWLLVTRVCPCDVSELELEARNGVPFGSCACAAFILSANSLLLVPNTFAMSAPFRLANGLRSAFRSVA